MSYAADRSWSDLYLQSIREIVGPRLLVPSSLDVDTTQAADLVVLKARDMTIAARVRRHKYADKYPFDFTIRAHRDSGAKTEMAKILEGWGDWMLYGYASQSGTSGLCRWWLIDLHRFREILLCAGYNGGWSGLASKKSNGDGTHFYAFDVRNFRDALIASSDELSQVAA